MKRFKLSVALLSSGLMAFSPVTQAAMNAQDKKAFNAHVRDVSKMTYSDLLREYAPLVDASSQAQIPGWIEHFGDRKIPMVQAQTIKDKNGRELLKLVFNDLGQTFTITINPDAPEKFDINGTRFSYYELFDGPAALKKMAETNKQIKDVADNIQPDRSPAAATAKAPLLTYERFMKMKPIERVEVLSLMHEAAQAADTVLRTVDTGSSEAKKTSQYFLHPLIAAQIAQAEVKKGTTCVVAGHLSTYHEDRKDHLACNPFTPETEHINSLCKADGKNSKPKGKLVACNPLVHGFRSDIHGSPFCVDSGAQPNFTDYATQECNKASPLDDPNAITREQKEAFRRKAYRRILASYAVGMIKGSATKIQACFDSEDRIKGGYECEQIFKEHQSKFFNLMNNAKGVCANAKTKTKDQPLACDELLSRDLWLNTTVNGYPVATVDITKQRESCQKAGGTYGGAKPDGTGDVVCKCPDGSIAPQKGNEFVACPAGKPTVVPPVTKPVPEKEKKDEGGLCKGGWMVACALLGLWGVSKLIGWFNKPGTKPPTTFPPGTLPPSNCLQNGTCPPVTFPPTTMPKPESDNGQPGSPNNGGTRSSPSGGTK